MEWKIECLDGMKYLTVEITSEYEIDSMTLGMITNNVIKGYAKASITQMDNTKFVKYHVGTSISITEYLQKEIRRAGLLSVFGGICETLASADDYMIDLGSIELDVNRIYVDPQKFEVYMICVPVIREAFSIDKLKQLFKSILFSAQFANDENNNYIGKLLNYLNQPQKFDIGEFRKLISSLISEEVTNFSETVSIQAEAVKEQADPVSAPHIVQSEPSQVNVPPVQTITPSAQFEQRQEMPMQGRTLMSSSSNVPISIPPNGSLEDSGEKPKKRFSLFGKREPKGKEEKPEKIKKQKTVSEQPQINIPGQPIPVNIPGQSIRLKPPVQSSPDVPKKQVSSQQAVPFSVQPTPQVHPASQVNFGETTVLGGGTNFGETTVLNGTASVPLVREPFLIRKKTGEKIPINKPVFRIGKERSFVDYFIADNTAISRSHANIITKNQVYYVTDTNSTNHTYVNGKLIASNVETPISSGDIIKLANEEFCFELL